MEKQLILLAIQNDLVHLLNKEACEMTLSELLQNKSITIHEGKFYLSGEQDGMTLDDFIDEFHALFSHTRLGVKGKQGSKKIIKPKVKRFKLQTGLSYEEMLDLAKYHIKETSPQFVTSAKYFFYKQDKWKNTHSKAMEILEEWKQEKEDQVLFNINMDD